jgi:RNA polymerase sigma-70 factor (ECF subfamily)
MEENTVIHRAREGDHGAFHQLYREHSERIYRLAYRYTRSQQDAEDLMQETFVKAFRQVHKFSGDSPAAFASWLGRICVNCSIDFLRKQKRRHAGDTVSLDDLVLDPVDGGRSPEQTAERSEAVRRIVAAAGNLSAKQRVVFDLRYSQHHSIAEIAALVGCSENAVKTHLSRSVKKLRTLLAPMWSDK